MGITGTSLPNEIGLFHENDGGQADWIVKIRDASFSVTVDNESPFWFGTKVWVDIISGGVVRTVGEVNTDSSAYPRYPDGDRFSFIGDIDFDSSKIVGRHNATSYDALPPGEGEWRLRTGWSGNEVYREPVTIVPEWVNPNVLALQNCSASGTDLRPGDQTTLSATIDNPSFDPLAGDAVAFVGGAETPIGFEVPPRDEANVEATFEVVESGTLDYGFKLRGVGHNY